MVENNNTQVPQIDGELYDYVAAVAEDVRQYIEDEGGLKGYVENHGKSSALLEKSDRARAELAAALYDSMFISDAVTGNASGSYWYSRYKANCALAGNLDLLADALTEFCADPETITRYLYSPESADVTIRCHLLPQAIEDYLEELNEEEEQADNE